MEPGRDPKKLNTELTDHTTIHTERNGPYAEDLELDALVVGAGFAGIFMLKTLRDNGFKTVIFEAGNNIGGTWRWNCYPGAGLDSEVPEYEFSWPEVYKTWNWSSSHPNYQELRDYFDHVDKIMNIKKDCSFSTVVTAAQFDIQEGRWHVKTADGRTTKPRYLILATGFAAKRYIPPWPGMNKFKGIIHHTSFWPQNEEDRIDVAEKRCAIIGTGASGVQMTQAWGPAAGQLKVFQRTPNLALPMRKRSLTVKEQEESKKLYKQFFEFREKTFGGFGYDWCERNTFDDAPDRRKAFYDKLWTDGGFRFWLASYKDSLFNPEANMESYSFWVNKTRARIANPAVRDLLAPLDMPHYFGIKRPSLEETYYEQFNRESVQLVDIEKNPIREFTETGILLEDATHHEFDVIALATGFDIVTGPMTQLGLKGIENNELEKDWASGAKTYLGMTVSGFPNMFYMYGAHAPTLLCNGPTSAELQGRWIADAIIKMNAGGIKYINAKAESADKWKEHIVELCNKTLIPTTRSTYMGGSIPGKVYEPVCYVGGTPAYAAEIRQALDNMEIGFEIVRV